MKNKNETSPESEQENSQDQSKETTEAEEGRNKTEGSKNTLVDDTNLAAKRLEDATAAAKEERLASEENYNKMKLGGQSDTGQESAKKQLSPEETASREKIKAVGNATGAQWAKDMDKPNGN